MSDQDVGDSCFPQLLNSYQCVFTAFLIPILIKHSHNLRLFAVFLSAPFLQYVLWISNSPRPIIVFRHKSFNSFFLFLNIRVTLVFIFSLTLQIDELINNEIYHSLEKNNNNVTILRSVQSTWICNAKGFY